jgi:hypothetical protein
LRWGERVEDMGLLKAQPVPGKKEDNEWHKSHNDLRVGGVPEKGQDYEATSMLSTKAYTMIVHKTL